MIINAERARSPQGIFIIYVLSFSLLIMIVRFILPGSEAPLLLYSRQWRWIKGLLELFNLFPALAFSALVVPFGMASFEENYQSFSEVFFKRLLVSVVIAIGAAVIYAIIFFLALPSVKNNEEEIRFKGELYHLAKFQMQERKNAGEWLEASQFLGICDQIWPNSPELTESRIEIEVNLQRIQLAEIDERYQARMALAREYPRSADVSALSGTQQPLNATEAISMGAAAYEEKRYFDAHWLATVGGRLAVRGSAEAARAARLASDAWNMISSLAPNRFEERLYQIYNLKLSGYQAMNTGDWIRAYYIFLRLLEMTPDDPDAINFLAASEIGSLQTAFFIDEMQYSLGEILTGAVFSLPDKDGRAVVRFSSLTTSADVAYGMGFEYMLFDEDSRLLASVRSRYAKILPHMSPDNEPQVLILTHALDRHNEAGGYESEWLFGTKTPGGIILNVTFEDLMLLSEVRRGLLNLQINELFMAARKFSDAGYVYQIFQAEILNRIATALFFLPMAIIAVVLGWRYRVKKRPRYLFGAMLLVLPVVFHGFIFMYRTIINTLGIWLVLSIGFIPALITYIVLMGLTLFISLIVLSAQHA